MASEVGVTVGMSESGQQLGGLFDQSRGFGDVLVDVMGPVVADGIERWPFDEVERVSEQGDGLSGG